MLLSQTAEYALRAMAWLATREEGSAMRATDLSDATDIPSHYLSKIMRRMVVSGLLTSRKGHGGGFCLAKPKNEIRYIDILSAVDSAPVESQCAFGWGVCDTVNPCPLHPTWSRVSDHFYQWATDCTLADVSELDPLIQKIRTAAS